MSDLAYRKICDGCDSEIFMAVCRDGRWRPFEPKRQTVPLSFAWAWRKRIGMEETDRVCGHLIHYCADYHDRAFQFAGNVAHPSADEIAAEETA
jgi:hypothetical protein